MQSLCLLVSGAAAVSIALLAAHSASTEHAIFYACDGIAAFLFIGYASIRWLRLVGPKTVSPFGAVLTWFLCLLLSFAAPSRRRMMLGMEDVSQVEPCEEGSTALWIALLLTIVAVFVPMSTAFFMAFGQFIGLQYLLLGLALPRPECGAEHVPRGGPGGPLMGISPLWISAGQLHTLAFVLSVVQYRFEADRRIEVIGNKFCLDHRRRASASILEGDEGVLVQNWLEHVVEDIENEERRCRKFLNDTSELAPDMSQTWVMVVGTLVDVISSCAQKLKCHSDTSQTMHQVLMKAMDHEAGGRQLMGEGPGGIVSDWLSSSFTNATVSSNDTPNSTSGANGGQEMSRSRHQRPLKTLAATTKAELCIGEWDFDALKIEKEQGQVLQLVGFELLRQYLPRTQLQGFLSRLQSCYTSGVPYHSHVHAADMCNSFYFLATKSELWHLGDLPDINCASMLLAGFGHDVGHFGRNNLFLINTRHNLAVTYNDKSVLENFHAASLIRLLSETYGNADDEKSLLLAEFSQEQIHKSRQLMISLILATDTQKHLEDLAAFRLRLGADSFDPLHEPSDQQQSLSMFFRAADIGHSAKGWDLHEVWSSRVTQEFHQQGDEEKNMGLKVSPLCDREGFNLAPAQVGFLNFICLPTWRELARCEDSVQRAAHHRRLHGRPTSGNRHSQRRVERDERRNSHFSNPVGGAVTAGGLGALQAMNQAIAAPRRSFRLDKVAPVERGPPCLTVPAGVVPGGGGASADRLSPGDKKAKRWIADVCLAACERNFQVWKSMAEAATVAPEAEEVEADDLMSDSSLIDVETNPIPTPTISLSVIR